MRRKEAEGSKSPQAPGPLRGYSLQFTRLTQLLLEKGVDWVFSLECFGDVGGSSGAGHQISEEDKSYSSGNPVADRSRDFWKTLYNWVVSVEKGELAPSNTSFIIYVSRHVTGEIVSEFSAARTVEQASKALMQAQLTLWGEGPDFALRDSVAQGISAYVTRVFEADPRVILQIIRNFELNCGTGSPTEDLHDAFSRLAIMPAEQLENAIKFAVGWVKLAVDSQLEANEPATIKGEEFIAALTNFVFNRSNRTVLRSVADSPSDSEARNELLSRLFVQQLEIIGETDEEKLRAVRDWWRSKGDFISWIRNGDVDPDAIAAFSEELVRKWEHESTLLPLLTASLGESEQGCALYRSCARLSVPLDGLPVESHVVCGTYHDLADVLEVGWHPRYREILGEEHQGAQ